MKKIIFIYLFLIPIFANSQYKGGSYEGYNSNSIGKYGFPDSAQLARKWNGGNYEGYSSNSIGKYGFPDSAQLARKWIGSSYDGYGFGFLGNWGQPDSAQLARIWNGSSYDGYGYNFIGRWGQPDSAQLARIWSGGSYDGFGYNLWGFFNTTYIVKEAWQHNENASIKSTIHIPVSVVCKIAARNLFYGDAIGLFYTRNDVLYCAGYGIWKFNDLDITVYADDPLTPIKDGFDANEVYSFKVWDCKRGLEYNANAVYHTGSTDKFTSGLTSIVDTLNVKVIIDHIIYVKAGWNMVSTFVTPVLPDFIQNVTATIIDNLVIAKNNNGNVYIPSFDINSIGSWDATQGYQMYLTKADTLIISGVENKPSEVPITLKQGWNMISYIRDAPLDAETALASITDNNNLIIAKDENGNVYIPSFGINTIGNMLPGKGYQIYVTNIDTLIYPDN
jgi:hypothetical protein